MQTSRDQVLWQHDAAYSYYGHGPLARTVLGELHVQGMDYAYTIQGWLKAINPGAVWHTEDGSCAIGGAQGDRTITDRTTDPPINGQYTAGNSIIFGDGFTSAPNDNWTTVLTASNNNTCTTNNLYDDDGTAGSTTARDAMGLQLDYYGDADYVPISGGKLFGGPTPLGINFKPLYNGNIAAMMVNVPKLGEPIIYNYQYDQLNRLMAMDAYKGLNTADANWTPISINDYRERLSYDPNGNILTYQRNGTGTSMSLNNYTYTYTPGTNRLANIANSVKNDSKNYGYDEIGNVTKDEKQDVANAVWNLYGKLQSATKTDGTQISYTYGADGQRISKIIGNTEEYYVKDATGNTMATYSKGDVSVNGGNIARTEAHAYGSSRLGILTGTVDCYNNGNGPKALGNAWDATRTAGNMRYEMTDARGNVLLTVTDRLVPVPDASGTLIDHNLADVVNITDYSSFGAPLPGRTFGDSRYGFNGQRKSPEIGFAAQTAEFWEYDGDVGRRWNTDPKPTVSLSPYSTLGNNPISNIDPNGDVVNFYDFERVAGRNFKPMYQGDGIMEVIGAFKIGEYSINRVIEIHNCKTPAGKVVPVTIILGYYAFRNNRPEYQLNSEDVADFQANIDRYTKSANIFYIAGQPSDDELKYTVGVIERNLGLAKEGAKSMWEKALKNPEWWFQMAAGTLAAGGLDPEPPPVQEITLKNNVAPSGPSGSVGYSINEGNINLSGRSVTNSTVDFVVTRDGKLVIGSKHYALSNGAENVQAAGQLRIYKGKVMEINNNSGHYLPSEAEGANYGNILKQAGVNVSGAKLNILNRNGVKVKTIKL